MPEAIAAAIEAITDAYDETDDGYRYADDLRDWWRSQPAPALRMTPELELVLFVAAHTVNHDGGWTPDYAEKARAAIAAVRAQAAGED